MNSTITFLYEQWIGYVMIAMVLLWSIYIWKEWGANTKSSFLINSCIALLALVSLAGMVLEPAIVKEKKSNNIVLLTDNFREAEVDSIKRKYKKIQTVRYNPNHSFKEEDEVYDTIFVAGHGVASYDVWQLENSTIVYLPSELPKGVTRYTYDYQYEVGEQLLFRGNYHGPQQGNKLVLEGIAGEQLDSIQLGSLEDQVFQLAAPLAIKGKYVYALVEKDSLGAVIAKDPIPISIEDPVSLKIMILNSAPTFETKYLKNYLAEMGHQLVIKSKITKGKYKFEYFNTEKMPLRILSEQVLESFDVLIIDNIFLKSLNKASYSAIENSVKKNGLGVFIQSDQTFFRASNNFGDFDFVVDHRKKTNIIEWPKVKISKKEFFFKKDLFLQSIHQNTKDEVISAYKQYGKGRIGVTTLENSYELQLEGAREVYRSIWSNIISVISKRSSPSVQWHANTRVGYKDEPFEFLIRTAIEKPLTKSNGHVVPILRDIDITNVWSGVTYPYQLGWNSIYIEKETQQVLDFFVMDTSNWKSKTIFDKIKMNKRYLDSINTVSKKIYSTEPIQQVIFFTIFILCMGYLWVIPKLKS